MQGIMRSFTSSRDMERLFQFSLLLIYLSVIESLSNREGCSLSQPDNIIYKITGRDAVLRCDVSSSCSAKDPLYKWFVFKQNKLFHLNLSDLRYSLDQASLHIKSLTVSDRGIYYCAVVSGGEPTSGVQYVGSGTHLEVKAVLTNKFLIIALNILIISSFIVVVLIIKKHVCKCCTYKMMYTSDKKKSTRKIEFHDVLQEMYSKRNFRRSKQTVKRNQTQVETASTECNRSNDDIYQNV